MEIILKYILKDILVIILLYHITYTINVQKIQFIKHYLMEFRLFHFS